MKIAPDVSPVERYGSTDFEGEFRIKATPKAFQILTSKLYKDKIAAIIRELSCNAYDSHVEAGHPEKPFLVHLPDALEPELVIRDYGIGLSDRAVRTIFTTFFESTKEDTNDQIGALGLGCKSPFSYTDTYTVKSFFNKSCTTYVCFIENSLPKIKRVSKVKTEEENGLEIRIAVAPGDFFAFRTKASTIFQWFDVHPTITGGGGMYSRPTRVRALREGAGWQYVPTTSVTKSLAVMGNVAYPIDSEVMNSHLNEFERKLLMNFVYHFNIGELDVQAGREELSYDRATIKVIRKRIKKTSTDLSATAKDIFRGCTNLIQANRRYLEVGAGNIFNLVPPRWNRHIVTGAVPPPVKGALAVRRHSRLKLDGPLRKRRKSTADGRYITRTSVIEPWDNTLIFIDDLKKGGKTRFTKFSAESARPCYLFRPETATIDETLEAFADFGEVRLCSSIHAERATAKVRKLNTMGAHTLSYLARDHRTEVQIDLDIGGVYVPTKTGNILTDQHVQISFKDLQTYVRLFWNLSANQSVYVVPWTVKKQFETHPKWKTLFTHMHDLLTERLSDQSFNEEIHTFCDQSDFKIGLIARAEQIAKLLPQDHAFHKFISRYQSPVSSEAQNWFPCMKLMEEQQFWPTGIDPRPLFDRRKLKLPELWNALDELPLLKAVASNAPLHGEALQDLANYARTKTLDTIKSTS